MRVRYGTYESNEEMLAKVMTGNSGWDVVFPYPQPPGPMARNGLIATLDHGRLPSLGNLDARFRTPPGTRNCSGACLTCGTPPASLTTRAGSRADGWGALWSPALRADYMLDDPEDVIGACLQNWASVRFHGRAGLEAAKAEAIAQKGLLRAT